MEEIGTHRNTVMEMLAVLKAVKPIRKPDRALLTMPAITDRIDWSFGIRRPF